MSTPLHCPRCNQSGAKRPGIKPERYPEAVAVNDEDPVMVQALRCQSCNHLWVVPVGTVEIRRAS